MVGRYGRLKVVFDEKKGASCPGLSVTVLLLNSHCVFDSEMLPNVVVATKPNSAV